jgi:hypothetical protein
LQGLLVYDLLVLMGQIFCIVRWLGLFSMRLEFVVVCSIVGIVGKVDHGIGVAYFLVWSLGCYLDQGLCYCPGI